jgi:steroid delta-isomerase-like uncharacterized protein
MTPEEMRAAYEEHLRAVNAHDLDAVMATFHEDCYVEDLAFGLRVKGREAVERYYEQLFHMFVDAKMMVEAWAFGDDVVVTWGSYKVTIPGLFLGTRGSVGPLEIASGATIATMRDGLVEGERIFLNLGSICDDVGVSIDQVRSAVRSMMT